MWHRLKFNPSNQTIPQIRAAQSKSKWPHFLGRRGHAERPQSRGGITYRNKKKREPEPAESELVAAEESGRRRLRRPDPEILGARSEIYIRKPFNNNNNNIIILIIIYTNK